MWRGLTPEDKEKYMNPTPTLTSSMERSDPPTMLKTTAVAALMGESRSGQDVAAMAEETRKSRQKETAGERETEDGERIRDVSFGMADQMDSLYARSERSNYVTSIGGPDEERDDDDILTPTE